MIDDEPFIEIVANKLIYKCSYREIGIYWRTASREYTFRFNSANNDNDANINFRGSLLWRISIARFEAKQTRSVEPASYGSCGEILLWILIFKRWSIDEFVLELLFHRSLSVDSTNFLLLLISKVLNFVAFQLFISREIFIGHYTSKRTIVKIIVKKKRNQFSTKIYLLLNYINFENTILYRYYKNIY